LATTHIITIHKSKASQPALRGFRLFCGLILAQALLTGCSEGQPLNLSSLTPGAATTLPATQQSNVNPTAVVSTQAVEPSIPVDLPTNQPTAPVAEIPTKLPEIVVPTVVVVQPPAGEAAWNAQKVDVVGFEAPRNYIAPGSVLLWWYDPNAAQFVGLGYIKSPIVASGQFRLRWSGLAALAVPYQINTDYGLVLEPNVVERMRRAGYTGDIIETFVYLAPDIVPQ
jgi:hypothetical protein